MIYVAIASVIAVSFGVWRLMWKGDRRRQSEALKEANTQISTLDVIIAVEEDRAVRQTDQDAADDSSDARQAADAAQDELSADFEPGEGSDGVIGGLMPTSNFDDELKL